MDGQCAADGAPDGLAGRASAVSGNLPATGVRLREDGLGSGQSTEGIAEGRSEPTAAVKADRVAVLDVLRGLAILGILLMNIQSFGRLSPEYVNPKALGDPPTVDWVIWLLNHIIADEKFISILTMLFGAGILLMARSSQDSPAVFERKFRRRMAWLFVFGMVHAVVLWPGDILAAYAICGLIAVRFRDRHAAELIAIGLSLFAAVMILWMLISAILIYGLPSDLRADLTARFWQPTEDDIAEETERLTTGWTTAGGERALNAIGVQAWMLASDRIWRMVGMMLIGMALLKIGFLSGDWGLRRYRLVIVLGLLIGIPVILAGLLFNQAVDWDFRYSLLLGRIANHWGSIAVSLAWVAVLVFLVKTDVLAYLWRPLAPVGRLAMSNYIGQSIICASMFYGFGLGLFAQLNNLHLLGVVVGIWVVQVLLSAVWYRHVGQGPLERLWRWLAR